MLTWVSLAQHLNGGGHFLLTDAFILLPLGSSLEPLPWQRAQVEVHEDVTQRLQVISPRLLCGAEQRLERGGVRSGRQKKRYGMKPQCRLAKQTHSHRYLGNPVPTDTQMGVDGGVAGSACEVLVLTVGDVLVRSGIAVFLGQAKVNDVDQVALFAKSHQEVVGLHVSMDEVLGVDVLNSTDLEQGDKEQDLAEINKSSLTKKVPFRRNYNEIWDFRGGNTLLFNFSMNGNINLS